MMISSRIGRGGDGARERLRTVRDGDGLRVRFVLAGLGARTEGARTLGGLIHSVRSAS